VLAFCCTDVLEEQSVHIVHKLNTVLLWKLLTYLAMQGLF